MAFSFCFFTTVLYLLVVDTSVLVLREIMSWRSDVSIGVSLLQKEGIVLIKDVCNSSQATGDSFLRHQLLQNMSSEPCPYPKFLVICISVRSLTLYYRHPVQFLPTP